MELARDGKLSFLARSVALFIWSHDEKWGQSASAVAAALDMDRGSVGKALTELQEHGWLVREIHQTTGPSGKPRTAWERWHLQMTNRRFTADEIHRFSSADVRVTPAPHSQTCGPHPHVRAGDTSTWGAGDTSTIEMQSGMHLEVHSSNAKTDLDETGFGGRSLAIGDEHPTDTEGAREAPEGLVGLQPPTAASAFDEDPFASEPAWRAEAAAARERRAASRPEPATAGGPPASPWE